MEKSFAIKWIEWMRVGHRQRERIVERKDRDKLEMEKETILARDGKKDRD